MNIVEIAKDYATVINSIVLIVLLLKNMADLRNQRLEYEKLERELAKLRAQDAADRSAVLQATSEDIHKYVIEPLARGIRRREEEFERYQHNLADQFHETANALHRTEKAFLALPDDRHVIRDLTELLQRNAEALYRLTSLDFHGAQMFNA